MRPELEPLPPTMQHLRVEARGYPVPAFVEWIDGKPEFRVMSQAHWKACVTRALCWVCGRPLRTGHLSRYRVTVAFLIGPMCVVNRINAEPPSHEVCAEWSARNCPFMARPHMVRREDEFTHALEGNVAGAMIKRNPGVGCVWYTDRYQIVPDPAGKFLIEIGEPVKAPTWWCEGRAATRAEVLASITSGLPLLEQTIDLEATELLRQRAHEALDRAVARARVWLPRVPEATTSSDRGMGEQKTAGG